MQCQVVRPFVGADGQLNAGEVVDVSDWLWTKHLIDQGYLLVVSLESPSKPTPPSGRTRKDDAHASL
jgi:hypothetical protein